MQSIGFITLGCAKNLVDAQIMAGELLAAGYTLAPRPEAADILVVNTCSFIHDAREEAAEAILSACAHRDAGGCRAVIVTGCLPQRYGKQFLRAFPAVDAALGIDQLDQLPAVIQQISHQPSAICNISKSPSRVFAPRHPTLLFSGGPFAYLKIAEGCAHRCAFCVIPNIRGKLRSRSPDSLLDEARALISAGVRELNLIAQDTTSYGRDLDPRLSLADLLARLDTLPGDFWLRILYAYPSLITDELLQRLAASPHILPYLDVPIQHAHPEVLKRMARGHTADAVANLPARLRAAVPNITLRTTCLVGFPGETEAHFEHLLDYIRAARFDHLGAFIYSPEDGTPAFDWKPVPRKTAQARLDRLMQLQRDIVRQTRRSLLNQTTRALLLRPAKNNTWLTRVERQAPDVDGLTTLTAVPSTARPGDLLPVTLTGGRGYDLTATPI